MKKPVKKETDKDRIDRLEHSLALAHLSIKRLQDHLHNLEHDKTILVAEIQKLKNAPSEEEKQKQLFSEMWRERLRDEMKPYELPKYPLGQQILYRQTNNPPCILDDSIPSSDERICCQC